MLTWPAMMVVFGTWYSLVAQELQKVIAATKVVFQLPTKKLLQL